MAIQAINVFILHRSTLQVQLWQKILQSQGWMATILPVNIDPQKYLKELELAKATLPDLLILEAAFPEVETGLFCQWVQSQPRPIPVLVMMDAEGKVDPTEKAILKSQGAFEVLPQFTESAIAIDAVNGLKAVASALGGLDVANDALVSCIMDMKRDMTASSQQQRLASPSNNRPIAPPQPIASPVSNTTPPEKKTKTRKYRGRDY